MNYRSPHRLLIACLTLAALAAPARLFAQNDDNPVKGRTRVVGLYRDELTDKIEESIKKGCTYLMNVQTKDGSWCPPDNWTGEREVGATGVILMGMLYCGAPPESPVIQRGMEFVEKNEKTVNNTYSRGAILCALALYDPKARNRKIKPLIERQVDWFLKAQSNSQQRLWRYTVTSKDYDMSTVQFALEGLRLADAYGVKVPRKSIELARDSILAFQHPKGGWGYNHNPAKEKFSPSPRNTMTAATTASLAFCDAFLAEPDRQGRAPRNPAIERGLKATEDYYTPSTQSYLAYSFERAGVLTGTRFFKGKDWYREIAAKLVASQSDDGGWGNFHPAHGASRSRALGTGAALLFLGKGLAPTIVGKLDFGPDSQSVAWDMRNLTDYVAKEMGTHLNWMNLPAEASIDEYVRVPVIYVSGTEDPTAALAGHKEKFKEYMYAGGILMGNAVGNSEAFSQGFRSFIVDLTGLEFEKVDLRHKFYTRHERVGRDMQMEAVTVPDSEQVKALLIGRPFATALAGASSRDTRYALRLGANIIVSQTQIDKRESFLREVLMPKRRR